MTVSGDTEVCKSCGKEIRYMQQELLKRLKEKLRIVRRNTLSSLDGTMGVGERLKKEMIPVRD